MPDQLTLESLEVYKLARELSKVAWLMYSDFVWQIKKELEINLSSQLIQLEQILLKVMEGFII